ncbi:MAG: arginine N-succinyltransferase [Planctomycetota bacterium]|jgi:arginine N-succinyltransferase
MFVIRQATVDDASTLLKLAKMVRFINLPADPDIINAKIVRSRRSFSGQAASPRDREFGFVLEDAATGNVIGTSLIVGTISWPGNPNTFLEVKRRELYSEDLQSGQVHVTLQLCTDESGPSEIGGLILGPSYRGHPEHLGAQLSLVRFHYMGLHREWFADRVIAEMMGALTPDSRNALWEYLGRRFINLSYSEADTFSQHSKEFIISLFPKTEIFVSLLPAVARKLIGRVGPETEPALAMLQTLGFEYKGHIDPFDGGPQLEAVTGEIPLVKNTRRATLAEPVEEFPEHGFISHQSSIGFRALRCEYAQDGDVVSIAAEAASLIHAEPGDTLGVTPLPRRRTDIARTSESAAGSSTG